MAAVKAPSRQTLHVLRILSSPQPACCSPTTRRALSTSASYQEEAQVQQTKPQAYYKAPDPTTVSSPRLERRLIRRTKQLPIGSRRRRMAIQSTSELPFEQLPYQCFQEARQVILADREEKLKAIETMRQRLARLKATDTSDPGAEQRQQVRLRSMQLELDQLKIYADVNDPLVKKRFEDGQGDMNKPIYRYLAERKWREYRFKILEQRINQMTVVPDIIPHMEITTDVRLFFSKRDIPPGEIVSSRVSEAAPRLTIQPFEQGTKLVTIALIDPDVPNPTKDGFDHRCHFLASNIPIAPASIDADLNTLSSDSQVLLPWLAPFSQKGISYQRFATFIFQQKDNLPIDTETAKARVEREGFNTRSFMSRHLLTPIGAHLFRSTWDEGTLGVMKRAGFAQEAEIEFKRKKVEPLPYKRRNPVTMRG